MSNLSIDDIAAASKRIAPYIHQTPILQSLLLNSWLGHQVLFKAECLQKIGAFKIRGAINTLAQLHEQGKLPKRIVANSSGNHAQAVAYAANVFEIEATIFCPQNASAVKMAATEFYGAELKICETREMADTLVQEAAKQEDTLWLPPFNHESVIAGQGTVAYEALQEVGQVGAIFAPCGGGGLLSGTLIAARGLSPDTEIVGAEPLNGNDAAQSLRTGKIQRLSEQPDTLADGAATLSIGDITFNYLQQIDDFYEVDEQQIAYWTQWLQHLLKLHVEPTSAMSMAAVARWLQEQDEPQRVLVILSGGNIDHTKMQQIWKQDYLQQLPIL